MYLEFISKNAKNGEVMKYIQSVNDTRNITQDREENVDTEIGTATTLVSILVGNSRIL